MTGDPGPLLDLIDSTLALYDVPWLLTPMRDVAVRVGEVGGGRVEPATGGYLVCANMKVDGLAHGLRATTPGGASLVGLLGDFDEEWDLNVPANFVARAPLFEIEDLLSLVVTTGWRRAGWVPLHAGGLVDDGRGLVVCAASQGGKTTFTVALVRRGWRSLGDDKLLLGEADGAFLAAGVKHTLNLDPSSHAWFPEVADIHRLPKYSVWTNKRRVRLSSVWPDSPERSMRPTHIVQIDRRPGGRGFTLSDMTMAEVLSAFLRQTVVPTDTPTARPILGTIGRVAGQVRGLRVELGDDAYDDPRTMAAIEERLT